MASDSTSSWSKSQRDDRGFWYQSRVLLNGDLEYRYANNDDSEYIPQNQQQQSAHARPRTMNVTTQQSLDYSSSGPDNSWRSNSQSYTTSAPIRILQRSSLSTTSESSRGLLISRRHLQLHDDTLSHQEGPYEENLLPVKDPTDTQKIHTQTPILPGSNSIYLQGSPGDPSQSYAPSFSYETKSTSGDDFSSFRRDEPLTKSPITSLEQKTWATISPCSTEDTSVVHTTTRAGGWKQSSIGSPTFSEYPVHPSMYTYTNQGRRPSFPEHTTSSQTRTSVIAQVSSNHAYEQMFGMDGLLLKDSRQYNRGLNAGTWDNLSSAQQSLPAQTEFQRDENREPKGRSVLDARYKRIDSIRLNWFYKVGRVFSTLWIEPAGAGVPKLLGSNPQFTVGYLDGTAYSEIRRFVVMHKNNGNAQCSPIHSYGGQGCLKQNLSDIDQHAIIYTTSKPPTELHYEDQEGKFVYENLIKDPIKVNKQAAYKEADLGDFSRVNYSKLYTVEFSARVLNIGMVDQDSLPALLKSSIIKQSVETPRRSRRHHQSNSLSRHSGQQKAPK